MTVSVILRLPAVHQEGVTVSLLDTIFTAISSVSVTGLTVINISDTYSVFGLFVLMFIFQFGGIGVMSLGTFFWLLTGKKIGLRGRQLIMVDHNQSNFPACCVNNRNIKNHVIDRNHRGFYFRVSLFTLLSNDKEAFLHGLFTSISATTNAGLDITGASMVPYANDYFVQLIRYLLLTLGAIGFPVLIECKNFLFHKKNFHFRFDFRYLQKLQPSHMQPFLYLEHYSLFCWNFSIFLKVWNGMNPFSMLFFNRQQLGVVG